MRHQSKRRSTFRVLRSRQPPFAVCRLPFGGQELVKTAVAIVWMQVATALMEPTSRFTTVYSNNDLCLYLRLIRNQQ